MQQIIQHLFKVDSLDDVPRERLEELVSMYPSFGMGRYLLSRKLRTADASHFSGETQKTNLYFSNPYWLHWLLQNEAGEQQAYVRSVPAAANAAAEERMVEDEQSWGMPDVAEEDTVVDEPVMRQGETITDVEQETGQQVVPDEPVEKPVIVDEPGVTAELAAASAEEAKGDSTAEFAADATAVQPVATADNPHKDTETLLQSVEEARGLRQALVTMNESNAVIESALEDISIEEGRAEAPFDEAPGGVVGIAESRAEEAGAVETQTEAGTMPESSVAAVVAQAAHTAHAESHTESGEPIVVFEPYHTIDYFASVGIKLIQEENPSDKLGKQLKSFTEWLKVMRKLPQKNQEIVSDGAVEHQIQAIAAHSITGKEILTETMAEVLVKQGMREKAMDVYHKLSLLNPDKSAYFASKIEQLKID